MHRRTPAVIAAAATAALAASASAALPTITGRSINMATSGYALWIPDNYVARADNKADILVLYHGDPTVVRRNLAYANLNTILVTVNLGAGSAAYSTPYGANTALFGNVLTEAQTLVRNQADFSDTLTWDKVGVSSFSAGYGAVREILKSATNYSTISNYAATDTIYAGYANGSTPPPTPSQMVDFKKFAADAKAGTKTMVLSHSLVETYTYCTTDECADDILASLSLAASPFTTPGQANDYSSVTATPFYRTANSGNFTLYGATGADANAHAIHLQTDGQFFAELNLMSKNYTVAGGATIADDIGVSSNVSFTGTVSASTINGQVQLPRRGGEHLFAINDSTAASDLTINGRVWGVGTTFVKLGAGTMALAGSTPNVFTGLTSSRAGTLELNKSAGVNAIAGNLQARLGGTVKWLQNNQVVDSANLEVNGTTSVANLNGKTETVGSVQFFAGTLSLGSGTLTVTNALIAGSTASTAFITGSGVLTAGSISAQGSLTRSGGGVTKMTTNSLSIGSTRRLDLTDTKFITPVPVGSITNLITLGRNGGAWNGNGGIVTSMTDAAGAAARKTLGVASAATLGYGGTKTFAGVSVNGADTLVAYTFAGDANLSGNVDGDDYFFIDVGFNAHATGWSNGDFNYSGNIDADDYFLIARNYGQGAPFSQSVIAVPEPTTLAWLAPAYALFHRRRR